MGPVRRGLILAALAPGAAFAGACETLRPGWDGTPATSVSEALFLASTLPALILFLATALALRFRSQWGGLAVVCLWTAFVTVLSMVDPTGLQAPAMAEGCVGSPGLFIAVIAAICVATILYTAPLKRRAD